MSSNTYVLGARSGEGDTSDLLAPTVGVFTAKLREGELVSAGQVLGSIDVLGVLSELRAPEGVAGRITSRIGGARTRVPVQYGDALFTISAASMDPLEKGGVVGNEVSAATLSFVAPMSGRFYSRPSPNDPPFVSAGEIVQRGQTIGLLEVMKTFNRLVYQGDALPERAVVEKIVPGEGDDVVRGDVILALGSSPES
jgi:acetyl-CoA carboxylase biotin carboxyl carrier protein